jgi:amino acid transporter
VGKPGSASQLTDNIAYAGGPSGAWITENKPITLAAGAILMGGLMLASVRGLAISKWLHNIGGFVLFIVLAAIAFFAVPRWLRGRSIVAPVAFTFPAVSLLNLNLLGRMGFGAFCGFDGSAIFSGEVRDPNVARTIRRSVWLSAPLIALFYILGTACVLTFTQPDDIDLISAATQAVTRGAQAISHTHFAGPFVAVLLICNVVGGSSIYYNAVIRLPMVAGWDHLLPAWFSRLHPRFKTPVGSIVCIAATTFVLVVLGNLGVGAQESFQLLNTSGIICWAFTYLAMFAIPLWASGERPRWDVRIAAASGFAMTLLYILLAAFPIIDVKNPVIYTAKMGGIVLCLNGIGAWYFQRASKRRMALSAVA